MRRLRRLFLRLVILAILFLWLSRAQDAVTRQVREIVLTPIRLAQGIAVSVEVQQIHGAIIRHHQLQSAFPRQDRFQQFVRDNFQTSRGDPTRDMWGQPYRYAVARDQRAFAVWSAGPDGRDGTSDDIRLEWRLSS